MASLNAVIVPAKVLKGGRHKVRISVAHNGETRYIVTGIILDSINEFKHGSIVKRQDAAILNTKLRGLLQKYQDVIDDLGYIDGITCSELVYQIKNIGDYRHRTLASIYDEYIAFSKIKKSTCQLYAQLWNVIKKYLSENILVENITHATILGLEKTLWERGITSCTVRNYLIFMNTMINYAKRCGYVQYRVDPFANYDMPKPSIRQAWLSVDEIKRIRDVKTNKKNILKCRDLFLLSYYLGGINMIDLKCINFNEHTDIIRYVRTKTENKQKSNKYVEFRIPDEAKDIINRLKGHDGRIMLSENQRKHNCREFFLLNMPKLAKAADIKHLIYYSARKSFSQHAFNIGVSESIIDYILGHKVDKGGTSLYSYITVTPDMATKAVRQVLDNLK